MGLVKGMTTYERIRTEANQLQLSRAAVNVALSPFWVIGYLVGLLSRLASWIAAAAVVGYQQGRGE